MTYFQISVSCMSVEASRTWSICWQLYIVRILNALSCVVSSHVFNRSV